MFTFMKFNIEINIGLIRNLKANLALIYMIDKKCINL